VAVFEFVSVTVVPPDPVNPVVVSVTVKVIVIVVACPAGGTTRVTFPPGKGAVPPEPVKVVAEFRANE
jgi:hypothetical protein